MVNRLYLAKINLLKAVDKFYVLLTMMRRPRAERGVKCFGDNRQIRA